jgi:hypothetical protein
VCPRPRLCLVFDEQALQLTDVFGDFDSLRSRNLPDHLAAGGVDDLDQCLACVFVLTELDAVKRLFQVFVHFLDRLRHFNVSRRHWFCGGGCRHIDAIVLHDRRRDGRQLRCCQSGLIDTDWRCWSRAR